MIYKKRSIHLGWKGSIIIDTSSDGFHEIEWVNPKEAVIYLNQTRPRETLIWYLSEIEIP